MEKTIKIFSVLALFLITSPDLLAQANPNPCEFPNVTCATGVRNGIVNSFGKKELTYASAGRSMPFWLAVGDTSTSIVDTSAKTVFFITKISGPGLMEGVLGTLYSKYAYLNNISFTESGTYQIAVLAGNGIGFRDTLTFTVPQEIIFCSEAPGGDCGEVTGNEIFAKVQFSNIITVDAVLPIKVGVIDSVSGMLDSTFTGTIYVNKLSGPGVMYGTLSMSGGSWFNFTNIRFTEEGLYEIEFYEEDLTKYKTATVKIEVINTTSIGLIATNKLVVYPNPFNNQLRFRINSKNSGGTASIYNYAGKKLLSQKVEIGVKEFKVDTHALKSGIYLLNFYDGKTSVYYSTKVIKH
tara:strand:+ start:647 stop:1702 length:1056 start_codon:yes stop_codon:yes gene_type:complete